MDNPTKLLVVDDDPALRQLLADYLNKHGYDTLLAPDARDLAARIARFSPDLVVLDRMMPGGDGADDYLGKPFDPRELLARIEAVLRRKSGASALTKDAPVHFGNFVFDPVTRQLMRDGEVVKLTGGEINLLEALVRNAGKPLSRERLLTLARDDESGERNDRAIDIAVLRLRRVIEDDPKQPRWIQTVWGTGYRFSP